MCRNSRITFFLFNCSTAECSWLRLGASCAMLKICEQKGVGDVYTVEQFYNLSQLVVDDVKQVREMFVTKLHKVNYQDEKDNFQKKLCIPYSLPIYCLAGPLISSDLLFIRAWPKEFLSNVYRLISWGFMYYVDWRLTSNCGK